MIFKKQILIIGQMLASAPGHVRIPLPLLGGMLGAGKVDAVVHCTDPQLV